MYPPERTQLQTQWPVDAGFSGDSSVALSQQTTASEQARLSISQRIVQDAQSANTSNATNGLSRFTRHRMNKGQRTCNSVPMATLTPQTEEPAGVGHRHAGAPVRDLGLAHDKNASCKAPDSRGFFVVGSFWRITIAAPNLKVNGQTNLHE